MIKYALQCDSGHGFESWFPDSASFDQQVKRGFVTCPVCASHAVEKQIMAPRVVTSRGRKRAVEPAQMTAEAPATATSEAQPLALMSEDAQKMRVLLRELHAHVQANTEDVGTRFADEARKIHYGEVEEKAIRGKASFEEAKALHEEGIGVLPLPPLPDERN